MNLPSISLTQASIVSLITFVLGLVAGHRLQLRRDRRKELNSASRPVRDWLHTALQGGTVYPAPPSVGLLADFADRLSKSKRCEFNSGVRNYIAAVDVIKRKGASPGLQLHEVTLPRDIALRLLRYTKVK